VNDAGGWPRGNARTPSPLFLGGHYGAVEKAGNFCRMRDYFGDRRPRFAILISARLDRPNSAAFNLPYCWRRIAVLLGMCFAPLAGFSRLASSARRNNMPRPGRTRTRGGIRDGGPGGGAKTAEGGGGDLGPNLAYKPGNDRVDRFEQKTFSGQTKSFVICRRRLRYNQELKYSPASASRHQRRPARWLRLRNSCYGRSGCRSPH
jgi:hypothetical protein